MTNMNMYRFIDKAKYITTVSLILVVASFGIWGYNYASQVRSGVTNQYGFSLGIDFTGGSVLELSFPEGKQPSLDQATTVLESQGLKGTTQSVNTNGLLVRTSYISQDQHNALLQGFQAQYGATEQSFSSVGPTLGQELQRKAFLATGLVLLAIILYVSYAFRGISYGPVKSWVFGLGAIVALIHDIVLVLGVFVVLGMVSGVQIDSLFVTALLTVLGFSVHDTIVVYDRIRENLKQKNKYTFAEIIDKSINSTLARSLNTSFTTLFVLTALYFFGGETIQHFVLALIIGIIIGTYSSIFIASPVLILGERIGKRLQNR